MEINRREFIKQSAIAGISLGLGSSVYGRILQPAAASNRIVVVINLFGGNDGLNTVIPLNQYDRYRQLRAVLGYDRGAILTLNGASDLGLNPAMGSMRDLFNEGKVAIIAGVGVPSQAYGLFDHAAQQFEFQSCNISGSSSSAPTGWLGRFLDHAPQGLISPGVDLGGGGLMLQGSSRAPLTIGSIEDFQLALSFDAQDRYRTYKDIMDNTRATNKVAEKNRTIRSTGLKQSGIIQERTAGYAPSAAYPENDNLAFALLQCAKIISADVGARALTVGIGSFDTHSAQDDDVGGGIGYHQALLKSVSDSILAFHRDLDAHGLGDRVLTLTFSEFGRRAYENNDRGTDHGYSSVAFAIGNAVKGGIYGGYPDLAESKLVFDGNMDVNTDFRSVYSSVIANFLDGDPEPAVGGKFPLLNFV